MGASEQGIREFSLTTILAGVITVRQGVTKSFAGLVVCPVLIGVFEAGFFPDKTVVKVGPARADHGRKGAIYLLSMYYKRHELQTRVGLYFFLRCHWRCF